LIQCANPPEFRPQPSDRPETATGFTGFAHGSTENRISGIVGPSPGIGFLLRVLLHKPRVTGSPETATETAGIIRVHWRQRSSARVWARRVCARVHRKSRSRPPVDNPPATGSPSTRSLPLISLPISSSFTLSPLLSVGQLGKNRDKLKKKEDGRKVLITRAC
jgi:hypothetical protein